MLLPNRVQRKRACTDTATEHTMRRRWGGGGGGGGLGVEILPLKVTNLVPGISNQQLCLICLYWFDILQTSLTGTENGACCVSTKIKWYFLWFSTFVPYFARLLNLPLYYLCVLEDLQRFTTLLFCKTIVNLLSFNSILYISITSISQIFSVFNIRCCRPWLLFMLLTKLCYWHETSSEGRRRCVCIVEPGLHAHTHTHTHTHAHTHSHAQTHMCICIWFELVSSSFGA